MNLSQIIGPAGPELSRTGAAPRALQAEDAGAFAASFRSLMDTLANGAGGGDAATLGDANVPPGGLEADAPTDDTPPTDTTAATPRAAAPATFVQSAFLAGWADVPPSPTADGDAADGRSDATKIKADEPSLAEASERSPDSASPAADLTAAIVPASIPALRPDVVPPTPGGGAFAADDDQQSGSTAPDRNLPATRSIAGVAAGFARAALPRGPSGPSGPTGLPGAAVPAPQASVVEPNADQFVPASPSDAQIDFQDTTGTSTRAVEALAGQASRTAAAKVAELLVSAANARTGVRQMADDLVTSSDAKDHGNSAPSLTSFLKASAGIAEGPAPAAGIGTVPVPHSAPTLATSLFAGLVTSLSAAAPLDTPDALSDASVAEIVRTIRMQATRGGGEAVIHLEPRHFGELTVSIRVEDGQVMARLQAESPAVREWLQANQTTLRQQLAEQQLTLDRFEVAEPAEPQSSDRRAPDDRPKDDGQRRRPRQDESKQSFEVMA